MGKIIQFNRQEENYINLSYKEIMGLISRFIGSVGNIKESENYEDIQELDKARDIIDDIYYDLKAGIDEYQLYQISEDNLKVIKDFIYKYN